MVIKRIIIVAVVAILAGSATMWTEERGSATPPIEESGNLITVNADNLAQGDVIQSLTRKLDGDCPNIPAMEIELTLENHQASKDVTVGMNDSCQIVVESIDVKLLPANHLSITRSTGQVKSMTRSVDIDWEVYARYRLFGTYHTDDESYFAEAETEVEYYLRETNTGFSFNYPSPSAHCESTDLPTITWSGGCNLNFDVNTSSRKKIGAETEFKFWGTPQMEWDQSATYDARIDATDRVICSSEEYPSFLSARCRGARTLD